MRNKKGFTLIELLVVIAIIALLLAIVIPAVSKAKVYARRIVCGNNTRQCIMAVNVYSDDNDHRIFQNYSVGDDKTAREYREDTGNQLPGHNAYRCYEEVGKPYHLAMLYEGNYITEPKVFYCPAQPRTTVDYQIPYYYDFYVGEGNPSDYDNPAAHMGSYEWGTVIPDDTRGPGSGVVRSSYNYWVYEESKLEKVGGYKPVIFDNVQDWRAVPHRKSQGSSYDTNPSGLSVAYADGHVTFCNDGKLFETDSSDFPWLKEDPAVGQGPGNYPDNFNEILRRLQAH